MTLSQDQEQTLVLIKPDAMKNSLTGYVLSQLSEFHTGLCIAGMKTVHVTKMLADEHYAEHRGKPFIASVLEYICGKTHYPDDPKKRRVIALVYQGSDAVKKIRDVAGPTNPQIAREKKPGCIRSLGTLVSIRDQAGTIIGERMDNLIHASASDPEAEREIKLWFRPNDIPPGMHSYKTETAKEHFYFKEEKLFSTYEVGSVCLLAPGDIAWKSDLDSLQSIINGQVSSCPLQAVAAKYLINEKLQD